MMDALYTLYAGFAVLFGLVWGSYWNVAIARWPEDRSTVRPRSACPSCRTPIAARDNIPVLSWVLLRGRCRSCGWSIPVVYPAVEILGGAIAWLCFVRFVPDPSSLDLPHVFAATAYFGFCGALTIAGFVDLRHHIIPDQTSIYAVPFAIGAHVVLSWMGYDGWLSLGWRASVIGALLGVVVWGTLWAGAYFMMGREALGVGDIKFMALIGAMLGPHPALLVVLFATSFSMAVIGIVLTVIRQRRAFLPLGPALAGWSIVYLFYADVLLPRWLPQLAYYLS